MLVFPLPTGVNMALTDIAIKSSKPRESAFKLSDGRGLQLHITPQGSRLWRWAYRHEGKQKLMALGVYPDVSLAQARDKSDLARKLLATGVDPMATRKSEKIARGKAPPGLQAGWFFRRQVRRAIGRRGRVGDA